MNNQKIEDFMYLLERFTEEEYDAALDGLIKACNSNAPAINPEAYIFTAMKNQVKDKRKAEKAQKEPTKMQSTETNKIFTTTHAPRKGGDRVPKRQKGTFEKFYSGWLFDNNLTDTIRNRSDAEAVWDSFGEAPRQPLEVSLDAPITPGSDWGEEGTELTFANTLLDDAPSVEEHLLDVSRDDLISLDGLKSDSLRKYLHKFIPRDADVGTREMQTAYKRALLTIIAKIPDWDTTFLICDIAIIAGLAGADLKMILKVSPSDARRQLARIEALEK